MTVILNPAAGGGRGRTVRPLVEAVFAGAQAEFAATTEPGQEEHLAREAAKAGSETIIAVGGDGTWGNVAHGIMTSGANPRLALLAAGTGNDFAKSVGAPARDIQRTLRLIRAGAERRVDVGIGADRVFLNDFGIGFDTAVLMRAVRLRKIRGGARYLVAALLELFDYDGFRIAVDPPIGPEEGRTLLLVFANGRWFGGVFDIAPDADVADGRLNVTRIANVRGWRRLALLAAATRGRHVNDPDVQTATGDAFTLRFDEPPLINTDGDVRRTTSRELVVRVIPQALRVVAPPLDQERFIR